MKLLKNMILILFLFLASNFALANFEDNSSFTHNSKEVVLSAFEHKNDIINQKEESGVLEAIINNNNLIINSRRHNQTNGSNDENICLLSQQKQNLLAYIYNKSYLDNKQKTALLPLLSQIQPHAP